MNTNDDDDEEDELDLFMKGIEVLQTFICTFLILK